MPPNPPAVTLPHYRLECCISLILTILATLVLEHSPLDVAISQHFYLGNGHWLIEKDSHLPDLIFYTGIKRLLIVFEVYVLLAWLHRLFQRKMPKNRLAYPLGVFSPLKRLRLIELGYLAGVMLLVPTVIATLKGITQVPCPNDLQMFGGKWEYLSLWQDILSQSGQKCFPAAHASSGFALYALCFVTSLRRQRWWIALGVTVLAWLMGGYKMAIGDHFFSHTLVAMWLGWTICSGMAWLLARKQAF